MEPTWQVNNEYFIICQWKIINHLELYST
jgi:hypothetical protein